MNEKPCFKCVVNETLFSLTMLLTRVLCAAAVMYFLTGIALNFRAVAQNTIIVINHNLPSVLVIAVCLLGVSACIALLSGYYTRVTAASLIIFNIINGYIFGGGQGNMIFLFFVILSIAALLPLIILGGGKYSMDFRRAVIAHQKFLSK